MALTESRRRRYTQQADGYDFGVREFTGPLSTIAADVTAALPEWSPWPGDTDALEVLSTRTVTGTYGAPSTTLTASVACFTASMIGKYIQVTGVSGWFIIAGYTSNKIITVTGDCHPAAAATFFVVGRWQFSLQRINRIDNVKEGLCKVTAEYGLPRTSNGNIDSRSKLFLDYMSYSYKLREDKDGNTIEVPYEDTNVWYKWAITEGTDTVIRVRPVYWFEVDLDTSIANTVAGLVGTVNNAIITACNSAPIGTLLMMEPATSPRANGKTRHRIAMAYNADVWNSELKVEKRKFIIIRQEAVTEAGAASGHYAYHKFWEPVALSETTRKKYTPADWSALTGYMEA